jgi:Zn-dependent protease
MNPDTIVLGLLWYVAFLFSLCCHESAHALAAKLGGDPTAFLAGQMTLNPVPHVRRELFGTVIVPIASYAVGGWMIGWASAPYDPAWRRLYPRRAAWMALAGPAANFSLAVLAAIVIRVGVALHEFRLEGPLGFAQLVSADPSTGPVVHALAPLLSIVFSLNVLLGTFNLLPVPPLDGNAAIGLLLPESWARRLADVGQNRTFALVGLLIAWKFFAVIFQPVFAVALNLIYSRK